MSRRTVMTLVIPALLLVAALALYFGFGGGPPANDAPAFQVIVIKPGNFFAEEAAEAAEAGGKVPPEAIDFTADQFMLTTADVQRSASGKAFLDLLRKLGIDAGGIDGPDVLRVRDGELITAEGGDALAGDNMSVMIIPRQIAMMFDDERTAFLQIRTRIAGLQ
jgi:hypothetical protein